MGLWDSEARINSVLPKLQSSSKRSAPLANLITPTTSTVEPFYKMLVPFCSAAKIAASIPPTGVTDVAEYDPIKVNFTTGSKNRYAFEIEFYVDPYDTSLVLGREVNGRLAIADNVFTTPEVSSLLTDTPYMAIDFTGIGTNPLQFIYDCCQILHERVVARDRSYPGNYTNFNVDLIPVSEGFKCVIEFDRIALNKTNLPLFNDIANNYIS